MGIVAGFRHGAQHIDTAGDLQRKLSVSFVVWRDDSSGGEIAPIIGEIRQAFFRPRSKVIKKQEKTIS